ncbi:MAG: phosphate--acyl-ACP acyltransferase [Candidatus Marinimicrobia bacterium]|nr:phosphate--acyl-ACP acyltransferase [Candidatus Neomarinimicrobiota bacterium]
MKIGLDIMSGDNAPLSNINGAIKYANNPLSKDNEIILYGNENIIKNNLSLIKKHKDRISFIYTTKIVNMDDSPSIAFKNKRNSSLIKIIDDLKLKKINASVSSGNTGALLASSLLILGKIEGIKRPALAPYIPVGKKGFILCDAGANSNVKPEHLVQFAFMSSAYLEHLGNINNPKIGLLNIGIEENKGNQLTKDSFKLLKHMFPNFIGNIESRTLFDNKVDIVICDGFTGNIVLKLIEGTIKNVVNNTMKSINKHSLSKMVKPVLFPVFNDLKKSFDYEEHGGTPLLGVNGIVTKCHGSSNAKAIENALLNAQISYENNLIDNIKIALDKNLNEE